MIFTLGNVNVVAFVGLLVAPVPLPPPPLDPPPSARPIPHFSRAQGAWVDQGAYHLASDALVADDMADWWVKAPAATSRRCASSFFRPL